MKSYTCMWQFLKTVCLKEIHTFLYIIYVIIVDYTETTAKETLLAFIKTEAEK